MTSIKSYFKKLRIGKRWRDENEIIEPIYDKTFFFIIILLCFSRSLVTLKIESWVIHFLKYMKFFLEYKSIFTAGSNSHNKNHNCNYREKRKIITECRRVQTDVSCDHINCQISMPTGGGGIEIIYADLYCISANQLSANPSTWCYESVWFD